MSNLMKCVAESDEVCRHLVCPRHRGRLAFCPWSANGHEPLSANAPKKEDFVGKYLIPSDWKAKP
jgi:hypothetical protein